MSLGLKDIQGSWDYSPVIGKFSNRLDFGAVDLK